MLCIYLDSGDPYFNLAAEEYLLKSSKESYFITSINNPSVIIGKHQIAHAEANVTFISEMKIPVIRRISGGGTVYHDAGNLNFTFIHESLTGHQIDFKKHTEPITEFLKEQDVDARFDGKNQINADGIKISGNAEHIYKNRVLHHGTILFESSLENLHSALKQNAGKYSSRAVQSNRTPVTNLVGRLKNIKNINELRSRLIDYIFAINLSSEKYSFNDSEIEEINALAESKYKSWEWNFAYGPQYLFSNCFPVNGSLHNCYINVREGLITDCKIAGSSLMKTIGKQLIGKRHMFGELKSFLNSIDESIGDDVVKNLF
jgi:lipoate---protein ligase